MHFDPKISFKTDFSVNMEFRWTDFSVNTEFRWTYTDRSWARIAALVPEVVSCAKDGDQIAHEILVDAVKELAIAVKAVIERLCLCGEGAYCIEV